MSSRSHNGGRGSGKARQMLRQFLRKDTNLRRRYFLDCASPKLQIGGGPRTLAGWLNTDLFPAPGVMQMDATRPFPFADSTFDYVFSEHMIEHIDWEGGVFMLKECHRVLRKGGRIRITTPNLTTLARLCQPPLSEIETQYMRWFSETFLPDSWPQTPSAVLSAFFYFWGHSFIYDEATLSGALQNAGFRSVVRRSLNQSDDMNLKNLENTIRYPDNLLEFESIALEATK